MRTYDIPPAGEQRIIGRFIDDAVNDQCAAAEALRENPWLRDATWILGESLVHFLAIEGYHDGVRWLLDNGFSPNRVNKYGDTALIDVVKLNNVEMARLLVEHGAITSVISPTYEPTDGTPLGIAELLEHREMIEFLNSLKDS